MTILVLGSSGQLATQLREYLPEAEFWGRADQDIADPASLRTRIRAMRPRAIINAAAYTAVDAAESDRVAAWRLNAEAPAAAAEAAADVGATLVQVSSDHVFDGRAATVSGRCPGQSAQRLRSEQAGWRARRAPPVSAALGTQNQLDIQCTRIELRQDRAPYCDKRRPLRIVADQYGRPTYAGASCRADRGYRRRVSELSLSTLASIMRLADPS
jgi:dTDP-4-dehydrorhamnose reductase